jgi:hypothetical protein
LLDLDDAEHSHTPQTTTRRIKHPHHLYVLYVFRRSQILTCGLQVAGSGTAFVYH